jgi:hypothetical protein
VSSARPSAADRAPALQAPALQAPASQASAYRAPAGDGERLYLPPCDRWPETAQAALRRAGDFSGSVFGRPLPEWRRAARQEILAAAAAYSRSYGANWPDLPLDPTRPIIVTGHQSEIFHPGVWLKNFAAAAAARASQGVALNLIVDSDLCRHTSITVPGGTVAQPQSVSVPLDGGEPGDFRRQSIPWEEREVLDPNQWRSFPERVAATAGALAADPMLDQWWPSVVERGAATGRAGLAISQARHLLEREWGLATLELPLSALSETDAFRQFAAHLLADLPRLRASHNAGLAEFRRAHRLRNHAQPVPDLAEWSDGAVEAPFWAWRAGDGRRRALAVRRQGPATLTIHSLDSSVRAWNLEVGGDDAEAYFDALARAAAEGVKVRPRALITTLFARLAFADLFVHGIGGAKYDEAMEAICRNYFGVDLPPLAVATGTLRLPIERRQAPAASPAELRRELRRLHWHGERFAEAAASPAAAAKAEWLAAEKTPDNAARRHAELAAANDSLRTLLVERRRECEARLASALADQRADRVLQSREYAFCLFPRERLRQFLLDSAPDMP